MTKFILISSSDKKKTAKQIRAEVKSMQTLKDTMFIDVFLGMVIGLLVVLVIFL